jgi:hypothetical protein
LKTNRETGFEMRKYRIAAEPRHRVACGRSATRNLQFRPYCSAQIVVRHRVKRRVLQNISHHHGVRSQTIRREFAPMYKEPMQKETASTLEVEAGKSGIT